MHLSQETTARAPRLLTSAAKATGWKAKSAREADRYDQRVIAIYNDRYSERYPGLYITPWQRKHVLNAKNLTRILSALAPTKPWWLDVGCGPAWHFSVFPDRAHTVGLDLSSAQLKRAERAAPSAQFICADMVRAPLATESFDLVTNFWGGYCYLDCYERIRYFLQEAMRWIRPGGTLYIEVLLAGDLESFNRSRFSVTTLFAVVPRSNNYESWHYLDTGGRHAMTSPPLDFFTDILTPHFERIEAVHDAAFMVHLIASHRKAS